MTYSPVVVRTQEVPISNLHPGVVGMRILHISDLHMRRWNRALAATQRIIAAVKYDLLLVSGDLGAYPWPWRSSARLARRLFEAIPSGLPAYASLGNHDTCHPSARTDLGIEFLVDSSVTIEHNGVTIQVAGVDQVRPRQGDLDRALANQDSSAATILLAHYPSTVYRLPHARVSLQVSGHTHGGQIRMPGLGCVFSNDRIPRSMARGLHFVDGTALHVSPGIGVSPIIPLRINCPPEATLLVLKTASQGVNNGCDR